MIYHLLVEDMEPNHWIAYARELPGCFSSAPTKVGAVANASTAIERHIKWLAAHARAAAQPASPEPPTLQVAEVFNAFPSPNEPNYIVNAFFEADRAPLTQTEIEEGLGLLDYTRRDLLAALAGLTSTQLTQPIPGEDRETLGGVLLHLIDSEWWYFQNLGLAPAHLALSNDPLTRLEQVRANTRSQLAQRVGDDRVLTIADEVWSTRKVLRRTLWHERDHTRQINAYRAPR